MKKVKKICLYLNATLLLCSVSMLLMVLYVPCMPPYVHFPDYNATPPRDLEGELKPKDWLSNTERLYEGKVRGPESIAFRGDELYTGVLGGEVLRLSNNNVSTVARFGQPCDDVSYGWKCGRPMGMRFHSDGFLYVTDAYHGLFMVDVDTGNVTTLVSSFEVIGGHRSLLPNDLDIAEDGSVYWSDASTNVPVEDVIVEFMAEPSGRLLRYTPGTGKSEALIARVQCANGVQLSQDEDFVLVAEGGKDRILRYYLKGPKRDSWDIFADGLPGVPDKVRSNGRGGFLVNLVVTHPGTLNWLRQHTTTRKVLIRLLYMLEYMFIKFNEMVPNGLSRKAVYALGNLEYMTPFLKTNALVLELDSHGNITDCFSSEDGSATMISELKLDDEYSYLASPVNSYLGRTKLKPAMKAKFSGFLEKKQPYKVIKSGNSVGESEKHSRLVNDLVGSVNKRVESSNNHITTPKLIIGHPEVTTEKEMSENGSASLRIDDPVVATILKSKKMGSKELSKGDDTATVGIHQTENNTQTSTMLVTDVSAITTMMTDVTTSGSTEIDPDSEIFGEVTTEPRHSSTGDVWL